jgi:hypothetical protein
MPRKAAFFDGHERAQLVAACSGLGADLAELLAELVDATSSIDNLVLARIKRVRFGRYFDLHKRIFLTFEIDGLARLNGGTGQKLEVAGQVVDHDVAVIRVDAFFHYTLALLG